MQGWLWAWQAWVMGGLCLEIWGVWFRPQPFDTFSEWTGAVTHTNSPVGYGVLTVIMFGLAAWYPNHVRGLAKRNALPKPSKEQ